MHENRAPHAVSAPSETRIVIGHSIEGREIVVWESGDGVNSARTLLIGGMHGAPSRFAGERNSRPARPGEAADFVAFADARYP